MNTPNIEKLLVRYYNDELPFDQTARVAAWIAASEENRKIAEQIYYICFAAETQDAKAALDTAGALRKVKGRIRAEKWRRTLRQVERAAAVMLLPLVGLSAYLLMQVGYKYNSMVEIRSTTGMVSSVSLPDDTRVWLNSNSYLRYPAKFTGKERRVVLYGEGYFDVTKDPERKFVVEAQSTEIEVYGTEFNVEAYDDEYIRATLVSGRIGMKYDDANHRSQLVQMMPDQQITYNARTGVIYLNTANIPCNTSWKEGKIVLSNTPLKDALRMIGNKYNVSFNIRNDELLGNTFTGTFSNQSLDLILKHFSISSKIKFRRIDQTAGDKASAGRAVFEVY